MASIEQFIDRAKHHGDPPWTCWGLTTLSHSFGWLRSRPGSLRGGSLLEGAGAQCGIPKCRATPTNRRTMSATWHESPAPARHSDRPTLRHTAHKRERLVAPMHGSTAKCLAHLPSRDAAVNGEMGGEGFDDIIMTVLAQGNDTTSLVLLYVLHARSQNPERHRSSVKNLDAVNSASSYCKANIREAKRCYPPGSATSSSLQNLVQLPGGSNMGHASRRGQLCPS